MKKLLLFATVLLLLPSCAALSRALQETGPPMVDNTLALMNAETREERKELREERKTILKDAVVAVGETAGTVLKEKIAGDGSNPWKNAIAWGVQALTIIGLGYYRNKLKRTKGDVYPRLMAVENKLAVADATNGKGTAGEG